MACSESWLFQPLRYELDQSPYPRLTPNVPVLAASANTAPPSCQLMLSQSIRTATRSASATSPPHDSCPAIPPHPWSREGAFCPTRTSYGPPSYSAGGSAAGVEIVACKGDLLRSWRRPGTDLCRSQADRNCANCGGPSPDRTSTGQEEDDGRVGLYAGTCGGAVGCRRM